MGHSITKVYLLIVILCKSQSLLKIVITLLRNCLFLLSFLFFQIKLVVGPSDFNPLHLCSILENCLKTRCAFNRTLTKGKYLESKDHRYRLHLRRNGNLVLTCGGRPIWTSFTKNENVDFLYFNKEETHMILCGKNSRTLWRAFSLVRRKKMILQDDRKLVLHNFYNESIRKKGNSEKCQTGQFKFIYFKIYHYLFKILYQQAVEHLPSTNQYCCLILQKVLLCIWFLANLIAFRTL